MLSCSASKRWCGAPETEGGGLVGRAQLVPARQGGPRATHSPRRPRPEGEDEGARAAQTEHPGANTGLWW